MIRTAGNRLSPQTKRTLILRPRQFSMVLRDVWHSLIYILHIISHISNFVVTFFGLLFFAKINIAQKRPFNVVRVAKIDL